MCRKFIREYSQNQHLERKGIEIGLGSEKIQAAVQPQDFKEHQDLFTWDGPSELSLTVARGHLCQPNHWT